MTQGPAMRVIDSDVPHSIGPMRTGSTQTAGFPTRESNPLDRRPLESESESECESGSLDMMKFSAR